MVRLAPRLFLRSWWQVDDSLRSLHGLCSPLPECYRETGERDDGCDDGYPRRGPAAFCEVPEAEEKEEWHDDGSGCPFLCAHGRRQLWLSEHREGNDGNEYCKKDEPEAISACARANVL